MTIGFGWLETDENYGYLLWIWVLYMLMLDYPVDGYRFKMMHPSLASTCLLRSDLVHGRQKAIEPRQHLYAFLLVALVPCTSCFSTYWIVATCIGHCWYVTRAKCYSKQRWGLAASFQWDMCDALMAHVTDVACKVQPSVAATELDVVNLTISFLKVSTFVRQGSRSCAPIALLVQPLFSCVVVANIFGLVTLFVD